MLLSCIIFTSPGDWFLCRLERNRASARVRRQRKKSMAELYEKEVARLKKCIDTLRTHVWGAGEGLALAEALGEKMMRHERFL